MPRQHRNQEGFILVASLMILLILTIMGIAMNRNTTTEIQIAANDRLHKQSFYEADGGTEFAAEVLEQNIACIDFSKDGAGSALLANPPRPGDIVLDGNIAVNSQRLRLWQNVIGTYSGLAGNPQYPAEDNLAANVVLRDMWLPPTYAAGEPHTDITVEGIADLSPGSSIILAAGYLGLGRSMAAGGVSLEYEIDARHTGVANSESLIRVQYRHVVGREDPFCNYDI